MNSDALALDALQTLSSRSCSPSERFRTASSEPPSVGQQRPVCMLCVHCPRCSENRSGQVSCELCRACHACSLRGTGCSGEKSCGSSDRE